MRIHTQVKRSWSITLPAWKWISHAEQGRVSCQDALMYRSMKPKLLFCKGEQSCGQGKTQAPDFSHRVPDEMISFPSARRCTRRELKRSCGDAPHSGKGLRPLHSCFILLVVDNVYIIPSLGNDYQLAILVYDGYIALTQLAFVLYLRVCFCILYVV